MEKTDNSETQGTAARFIVPPYILFMYNKLRDCRLVKMADATGTVRDGLFIPLLQNGIRIDAKRGIVFQYLRCCTPRSILKHAKVPYEPVITKEAFERMVKEGLISEEMRNATGGWGERCLYLIDAARTTKYRGRKKK